jgi:hypothetical protein
MMAEETYTFDASRQRPSIHGVQNFFIGLQAKICKKVAVEKKKKFNHIRQWHAKNIALRFLKGTKILKYWSKIASLIKKMITQYSETPIRIISNRNWFVFIQSHEFVSLHISISKQSSRRHSIDEPQSHIVKYESTVRNMAQMSPVQFYLNWKVNEVRLSGGVGMV